MTALGDSLQPGFAPLRDHGYGTLRLRHGPYDECLDGVSDALAYRLRASGLCGPYATAAIRPRLHRSRTTRLALRDSRAGSVGVTGARQRYRAVLMTTFSFILGVLPLVIASGAGANSRRAIGTTAFSGMLAATLIGIFLIPALYVVFQSLREKVNRKG